MTICTVLRTGGRYDERWVEELREGVHAHMPDYYQFVSVTDLYDWPGWWLKMALFDPSLFKGSVFTLPVLYIDLDSVIVGDLSHMASYAGGLALLRDFNQPQRAQSGVMLFNPGWKTERLWKLFSADPERWLDEYRGDGEWLHDATEPDDFIQDLYPGQVVSYKNDVRKNGDRLPPNARILAFHGEPKNDTFGWRYPWQ